MKKEHFENNPERKAIAWLLEEISANLEDLEFRSGGELCNDPRQGFCNLKLYDTKKDILYCVSYDWDKNYSLEIN